MTESNEISGFICLMSIVRHHGLDVVPEHLLDGNVPPLDEEMDTQALLSLAAKAGLRASSSVVPVSRLPDVKKSFPAMLQLQSGGYVIVVAAEMTASGVVAVIHNPSRKGELEQWDQATCETCLSGTTIMLRRQWRITDTNRPFGLLWFAAELAREKTVVINVCIAAMMLHILGLATPFFTQIVIDKVLVHQTISTLTVLSVGVLIVIGFEVFISWAKGIMTVHASSKMDLRVARRIFAHLLSLPVSFFEKIPSGVLAKHVEQYSQVREFLFERLLGALLDAAALFVYVPLLYFYSPLLATVVLAISLMIAVVVAVVAPKYRGKLLTLYQAEADRQSLLVESLHGISTTKALSLEAPRKQTWERYTAIAAERTLAVGGLSLGARAIWQLLEKILPVVIVVIGVHECISGAMTVGTLIAFQMISGRVIAPITQLAGLINEFQRALLSVSMLKGIMLTQPEQGSANSLRPSNFSGEITFDGVSFIYPGANRPTLDRVSFQIPAGTTIGIVGPSGSGKTTLTKILQGLYQIHGGQIFVDNIDAREIDKSYWRQRIGVVPQHSFLFRGSIRSNIALSKKGSSFEEVVEAAKLAGAHEFISQLPEGYDTQVEEGATNLSGGQAQRISIARALLRMPKILIFDEATSSLDPESERIVQANMKKISQGRTVIIVSHRIKSLSKADKILVFDSGQLVGFDNHENLLENCPTYKTLYQSQID